MKNIQFSKAPFYMGSKSRIDFPMGKLFVGGTLFVEPQEFSQYRSRYAPIYRVFSLKENDRGFAYMLNAMLAQAKQDGCEYFLFCDDDLLGFKWREKNFFILDDVFSKGVDICKTNGYSQLMISFAGHNWFFKEAIKEKIGAWGCWIGRTEDLLKVGGYDESLKIFNDWDISAQLILAGFKTACWYEPMFLHKMKSQKGGAEMIYADNRNMLLAIEKLKEKYGDKVIKMVDAHGQKEARFRWSRL